MELVCGWLVLEDGDAARVRANDDVVCRSIVLAHVFSAAPTRVLYTLIVLVYALTLCRFQKKSLSCRRPKKKKKPRGATQNRKETYLLSSPPT